MLKPFLDVERLGKEEVEGILQGACYIFPKLDGTNASIWLEDNTIKCGSRNRELNLTEKNGDNLGFCRWVAENLLTKLDSLFKVYPNWRFYGEFLKPHSLKTYRDDMWNRFWIFDVFDIY